MSFTVKPASEINNTHAVFVEYEQNDRGYFILATLGEDDWGDRAVVVKTEQCGCSGDCLEISVAPDSNETVEVVHVSGDEKIAVEDTAVQNTVITLKFKTGHPGYVAHTEAGKYEVFKTHSIYSGIKGGGTYTSWRADFTPLHGETVHVMLGNKYQPEKFNSVKADTKRLAVFACNAHANGAGNEAPKK